MSNAQDLLSIIGGGGASRGRAGGATTSGTTETSILNFKAGKMNTTLKPNGKYLVEPDTRRGELHVVWTATATAAAAGTNGPSGHLKLEWKDRRTKTTVNTIPIFPTDDATFERVETGKEGDRVYLLQCGSNSDSRHFFWMQDKNITPDEDLCVKVNLYMSDYSEAASAAGAATPSTAAASGNAAAAGAGGMDNAELLRIMQGALGPEGGAGTMHDAIDGEGARTTAVPGSDSVPTASAGQVDALGNIMETLGIPQQNGIPAGEMGSGGAAAGNAAATAAGGLTLADLQGAMAGLATASPPSSATAGPPLSELAQGNIIDESGILGDPSTVERLVALLPEGQRTESNLRENIRSPQVAQCLQRLTSALADDGSSFNSIIANFQLNPADGATAMAGGNPIEAFLNCLLKDVEKKEGVKKVTDGGEGETKEDGGGEDKTDGAGGNDGDVKMDES